jgi:methionine import ATP-binding protein metN
MIEIENLRKSFGGNEILKGVSATINDGEIFAIVGQSGAGKSTLLRCINALESYDSGSLRVNGKEVLEQNTKQIRQMRKNIGMIFQNFALLNQKNVFENVALPLEIWGEDEKKIRSRVGELLEIVGLSEKINAYPRSLSGGQKQRVAIARALALNPQILLSDEATSALDPNITNQILSLLKRINADFGITIILVTHEMEVVKSTASRALLLSGGEVVNYGETWELFLKPDAKMREFLGEKIILPNVGVNFALYFQKEVAFDSVITQMARDLNINLNIVWGKIEELGGFVLGFLVINTKDEHCERVAKYLEKTGVLWEILS